MAGFQKCVELMPFQPKQGSSTYLRFQARVITCLSVLFVLTIYDMYIQIPVVYTSYMLYTCIPHIYMCIYIYYM